MGKYSYLLPGIVEETVGKLHQSFANDSINQLASEIRL
jgi:hypothetical protein